MAFPSVRTASPSAIRDTPLQKNDGMNHAPPHAPRRHHRDSFPPIATEPVETLNVLGRLREVEGHVLKCLRIPVVAHGFPPALRDYVPTAVRDGVGPKVFGRGAPRGGVNPTPVTGRNRGRHLPGHSGARCVPIPVVAPTRCGDAKRPREAWPAPPTYGIEATGGGHAAIRTACSAGGSLRGCRPAVLRHRRRQSTGCLLSQLPPLAYCPVYSEQARRSVWRRPRGAGGSRSPRSFSWTPKASHIHHQPPGLSMPRNAGSGAVR